MKTININNNRWVKLAVVGAMICLSPVLSSAQTDQTSDNISHDYTTLIDVKIKPKPAKNTFQSIYIIDNQTVMVPVKGTFEMDILHRFGAITNGYKDFWGLFAPSNIRLGFGYSPINKLFVGFGITKMNMIWDASAKYALLQQTAGFYPVSVTYYGNMAVDTRENVDNSIFKYNSQRYSFFNQLIFARKINNKLSVQIAPSISHQNGVDGFYTKNDSTGKDVFQYMKFDHWALAMSARYKMSTKSSFMVNYDQPLTKHNTHNPSPNLSFGIEMATSGHSFQMFFTNFFAINPQQNNLYNQNSPFSYTKNDGTRVTGGKYVFGFNITRLW